MPKIKDPSLSITAEALPINWGEYSVEEENLSSFPPILTFINYWFSPSEVKSKTQRMKSRKVVATVPGSETEEADSMDPPLDHSSPGWARAEGERFSKSPFTRGVGCRSTNTEFIP